jgi:hypothetical protein
MFGILGIITLVNLLGVHDGINSGSVTLACDGLSALQQSFYDGPAVVTRPDLDLIHTLRHHLKVSKLQWSSLHVNGHQEDFKAWAELTWWEKQNVRMDHAAKDKMKRPSIAPSQHVSSHEGWSFWRKDQKHTFYDHDGIYKLLCEHRVIEYWLRRERLSLEATRLIDWEVLSKACDEESPGHLRWVTKDVTGVCGVGKFLKRWKSQDHSRCPRCDAEDEDYRHVYQCPAQSTKREWYGALNDLRQWCNSHDTSPDITEVMIKCLKAWQAGRRLPPYRGRDPLAYAYDAQRVIGWGCFLEGSLSNYWLTVQASYFILIGSRKAASVWARGLTQQLWKVAFRLWLHRNSWQHSDKNLQHQRAITDLDKQITYAYALGSAVVQPEHHHIFKISLPQRLKTTMLDKQKWVECFELAQAKARAHKQRRGETRRRFRAWATSGPIKSQPSWAKQHRGSTTIELPTTPRPKQKHGVEIRLPPLRSSNKRVKRPIVLGRLGGKRKRLHDSNPG